MRHAMPLARPRAAGPSRRRAPRRPAVDRLEDRTLLTALLDPTFGVGGRATVPFDLADAGGRAAAIQPDGRVVVVGSFNAVGFAPSDFLVARYNTDGSLDTSFSGDGITAVAFNLGGGNNDFAFGVALQADGRIVVVGGVELAVGYDFGVARLNNDGSLDSSFDGDGRQTITFDLGGSNNDTAHDVAIDSLGRIVVVGTVDRGGGDTDFGVARLNPDGSFNTIFGAGGRRTVGFNLGGPGFEVDEGRAVAVQPDDRIVVAGTADVSATDKDFALARLNNDGSLDGIFGAGGRATVPFDLGGGNRDKASDLAILPDGNILVSGTVERPGGDRDFGVTRLTSNGVLDVGFGAAGIRAIDSPLVAGSVDVCNGLAVQGDGSILLVGEVDSTSGGVDFGVARLTPGGGLDFSYSGDGWQTVGFNLGGSNRDTAQAAVIQADGRAVAVGQAFETFVAAVLDPVALVRLNTDGSIDTSYGGLGRVAERFGLGNGLAAGMVPLADGRSIVAGTVLRAAGNTDFAVARINPDGSLDPAFGVGGVATIAFDAGGSNMDRVGAVAVQPDGRIVVVGTVDRGGGNLDFGVARLNVDGGLDGSFNAGAGTRIYAFNLGGLNQDEATAVAIQETGEIVIGGTVQVGVNDRNFVVIRVNPDSNPDFSFGAAGRRFIPFDLGGENQDELSDLAIQPDGRIVAAGTVDRAGGNRDFGVARLTSGGDLDLDFNDDGLQTVPFDLGGGNVDRARGLAIQPDGRIVVAGAVSTSIPGDEDFGVARLTPEGNLDPSFGGDGRQTVAFNLGGTNIDRAFDVTIQDGRILLAGSAERDGDDTEFAVARLRENGVPDGTFAANGRQTVAFNFGGNDADVAVAVAALPDDRILLLGTSGTDSPPNGPIVTMARLRLTPTAEGDYDGDGQTDLASYRYDPAAGAATFHLRMSRDGDATRTIAGVGPRVVPVFGDFDGDGITDVAVVDPLGDVTPGASTWIFLRSGSGLARHDVPFGATGELDRPAPADYDGDGTTDIATFRADSDLVPGAAQWFILPSIPNPNGFATTDGAFSVVFGAPGGTDLPAPADYDGDGHADIATFRPVSDLHPGAADWFILPSGPNVPNYTTTAGGFNITFGAAGNADQPAVADFVADGRADIVAFRSDSDLVAGAAQWFILPSSGASPGYSGGFPVTFGVAGEIAAVGDYDRDGRPDLVVFNTATGTWTLRSGTSAPDRTETFGPTGEGVVPVLAPLYFRLRATQNLPDGGASTAARRVACVDSRVEVIDRILDELGGSVLDP